MKNKTPFIILLTLLLVLQSLTPVLAENQKNKPEIKIDASTFVLPGEPFSVNTIYRNDTSYSGNKDLVIEYLVDEKVVERHQLDSLKPNEKVEINKEILLHDYLTSSLQARVIWTKPASDSRSLVAESNILELTTDPNIKLDSDQDGVADDKEEELGTDSKNADSDQDGLNDGHELIYTTTNPTVKDTDHNGVTDNIEDSDKDGLTNKEEIKAKTNPGKSDTDGDGLTDSEEINNHKTNPSKEDTDEDLLLDGSEIKLGFDPLKQDTDGNGVIDSEEITEQDLESEKFEHLSPLGGVVPSITFRTKGDINHRVGIQDASKHVFLKSIRAIIGKPVNVEILGDFESAVITLKIEPDILEKHKIENLRIGSFNEEESRFIELETDIDTANNTLTAIVSHFSPVFAYDKGIYDYDRVSDNTESTIEKGPSDIVFVIDSTGSMGSAISNVKNNINSFVNQLAEKKVDVRLGLVEFKDISADGLDSTKNFGWFTDVEEFKTKVSGIRASGGGDAPESAVDALEEARGLEYRQNVGKYIVLLTDVNYKASTRFAEVTSMHDEIQLLKEDEISVSVIGNSYYRSFYDELYSITDGIWASLYGNFASNLVPLIDKIEEDVGSYVWIRLATGNIVKLKKVPDKEDLETDSDGDTIPDSVELDKEWTGYDGVKYWTFSSNPSEQNTDGDGYSDFDDRYPKQPYAPSIVFVHGRISNTKAPFGAVSAINPGENDDEFSDIGDNPNTDTYYTNPENQLIKRGSSDMTKLMGYLVENLESDTYRLMNNNTDSYENKFFAYNYPNRGHLDVSGVMLDRFLNNLVTEGYLETPDKEGKVKPGVIFITHSAGGLVSRYYNEKVKNSSSKVQVESIMTLATPHWGGEFYVIGQDLNSPETFGLTGFDMDKDLYPEPYVLEQEISPQGDIRNIAVPTKSFTEKLNEDFLSNKGDTKYFALAGVSMAIASNPMSVWYPETREGQGTNYVALAQQCLNKHDNWLEWNSRPTLWNDTWVSFHSALGSNYNIESDFSDDKITLDFDRRYVVVDTKELAGHNAIYNNQVSGVLIMNWLKDRDVMPDYVSVNAPTLQNDCQ
ncbi:VWA domain-containing protein [Planococcus lenghuensis]|uniref:VWFA domain-containing protein n=1 Tax=Planococcus lenghuensis TaxID=2213202 RepID=A0A1Q2L4R1_9BACL|nr:VWA domain-containing protein [Planococcus lenghuensis]AQQ54862.1 hypothetical protein B0X71_18310 [Planococcus lenghuensis]